MELDLLNNISRGQNEIDVTEFQRELTNKLEEMESSFTIDRFEGDVAVLENRDTGEMLNVNKKDIPQDAKEGTILKLNKDKRKNGVTIMAEKKKDEDKLSLWEKSKLGRKTKVYKIKTWLSRLVSLIILIVLLLLGKNYWETHDYDSFIRNALGNQIENDIVINDIKQTNTIENEAVTAGNLRVYYLDVGQADSILVQMKQEKQ